MYYLFRDPVHYEGDQSFIQLTFNNQRVATCTEWASSIPTTPSFTPAYQACDDWSTLDEWLSHDDFILLATSPTPITSLTHPELSI